MTFDHGELNLPLHKRGGGSLDSQIDKYLAAERREARRAAREMAQARRAARAAERQRPQYTAADLIDAAYVRDRFGWHEVVRVNKVTVTVKGAYLWNESIRFGAVLEFRTAAL